MPKSSLSRLSLRVSAPALLVSPVLLTAVVLILIGAVQGRAAVERLATQQLEQIHDQIAQHMTSLLNLPEKVDRINIALIESGRLDTENPRQWGPMLIEQFRAFEALSAITWGDADGRCTWVARYVGDDDQIYYAIKDEETGEQIIEHRVNTDGRLGDEPSGAFEFDPRTRPWYTAPARAGEPTWTEPFLWVGAGEAQTTLGIAYGWPHYNADGELLGVMDADLSLHDISRYMAGLRIGRTGRAFIVDGEGRMLATSTDAPLTDTAGERLAAEDSDSDWIASAARILVDAFGSVGAVDRGFDKVITVGGEREWLRATPFEHPTGLSWTIVTMAPESDFMAEILAGRRRSAWFAVGVTLGALGLGLLFASLLVRPILDLSRHVRRLGDGDLEREIDLPYARELVRLSDDINRMTADLRDRVALRRSLALAMEVQQSLLPSATPRICGLDIAGHSKYCDETGGDYYDYLDIADLTDNAAAFAVGDVMGHGVAAAMLMATARGVLRSRCTESGSLGELLTHLNDMLVEVTGGVRFMTMVLVTLNGDTGELSLSSAGHDPPFIYDPRQDAFIDLDAGGLPLGIVHGEQYPDASCGPLPPGSVVLISTDGVWEARNESDEQFGKERVCRIIRDNAGREARQIARTLHEELQQFCGDTRQLDDITFVVVRRVGGGDLG